MNESIEIPATTLPLRKSYDVVVVGGGIAGVAAAVAAARNGAKTLILEKENAFGGLATLGNVIVYLPLCDGQGKQVAGGLAEELLKLSVCKDIPVELHRGGGSIPQCWLDKDGDIEERKKHRYRVELNPTSYILDLEQLLIDNKVDILYDSRFCDVAKEGDRITALIIENKSGRQAIKCKTVLDCTGDADVCERAGEQTITICNNVCSSWFYYTVDGEIRIDPLSQHSNLLGEKQRTYSGTDGDELTAQIIGSRKNLRNRLETFRKENPYKAVHPFLIPSIATVRMTRRLIGAYELKKADDKVLFDDTVALAGEWRNTQGSVYAIPYRSLVGVSNSNLATAGRSISSGNDICDLTRVIPTCAVTGEAAGTAAALACRENQGDMQALSITLLQETLLKQNVILNF